MLPVSEHTNEEDDNVFDFWRIKSSEGNNFVVPFDCDGNPFQDIFNALRPIDFSSLQKCSPLLEIHMNEVATVFFLYSTNEYRKLFILLSSIWIKPKKYIKVMFIADNIRKTTITWLIINKEPKTLDDVKRLNQLSDPSFDCKWESDSICTDTFRDISLSNLIKH